MKPYERIIVLENEEITFSEAVLPAAVITVLTLAGYLAWEKLTDYRDKRTLRKMRERVDSEIDKIEEFYKKLEA